jgi:hypothetical protein
MLQFRDAIFEPLDFFLQRINLLLVGRDDAAQGKLVRLDLLTVGIPRASHQYCGDKAAGCQH